MAYHFLDLAYDVLKDASGPLTHGEIWKEAVNCGLAEKVSTKGKTPWASLGSMLSVDVRLNTGSKFATAGKYPQKYFLKSREQEISETSPAVVMEEDAPATEKTSYHEQDLHPLLTYFVHSSLNFHGEKRVYSKTIAHQKSKKKFDTSNEKVLSKWLHPDMVGAYFPFKDLEKEVIDLGKFLSANSTQIFSFELKKSIDTNNYRECFFQAVSNSSWANEGYLVATKVSEDEELHGELARLTNAFGIGIIQLNVDDIDSSHILFQAENKSDLDWGTIDKLCNLNPDFRKFVDCLNASFRADKVFDNACDEVKPRDDLMHYIQNKLGVKSAQ